MNIDINKNKQHLKDFLESERLEFSTEFKAKCRYIVMT